MSGTPILVIGSKNYSSWSLRPWLHLRKLRFAFEEHLIAFDLADYRAQIRALSPSGRVPLLLVGETAIGDSLAICEFASDVTGQGRPAAIQARAVARSIAAEMHAGFQTLRESCPMNVRGRDRRVTLTPALREDIARIDTIWSGTRARWGADGPWLLGDYSLADAMFAPVVYRFQTYGATLSSDSIDYMNFVLSDPVMHEWSAACESEPARLAEVDRVGMPA